MKVALTVVAIMNSAGLYKATHRQHIVMFACSSNSEENTMSATHALIHNVILNKMLLG